MKLKLFSDPHIGLNRTSHTTPASRQLLKQALVKQVQHILQTRDKSASAFCLGDLFDTHNVDNNALIAGYSVYHECDLVLFGNHDLSNRVDAVSSIEVIDRVDREHSFAARTTPSTMGEAVAESVVIDGLTCWWVDHKLTQTIFEEAINAAYSQAEKGHILLLHCNYESPFASQESTLNLTRELAEHLLTKFSYIFLGHEHMPRTDLDDRIRLVGNTHPTGFADLSDKFAWDVTIENGQVTEITPQLIWSLDEGYLCLDWTALSEVTEIADTVQFIEVKGTADQQHMPTIASQVSALWRLSDNLLMVRNNVVATASIEVQQAKEFTRCQSIPERISSELKGTPLATLWAAYLEAL
jgi:DNA repair exonuclease SbcCD nuclease subunit